MLCLSYENSELQSLIIKMNKDRHMSSNLVKIKWGVFAEKEERSYDACCIYYL